MSKVMYKARARFRPEIIPITVDGETAKSVKLGNRLERKMTTDAAFFNTFMEAKAWLWDIYEQRAERARRNLEIANGYLGNVKGMKEHNEKE
jgi:hypothetical protein